MMGVQSVVVHDVVKPTRSGFSSMTIQIYIYIETFIESGTLDVLMKMRPTYRYKLHGGFTFNFCLYFITKIFQEKNLNKQIYFNNCNSDINFKWTRMFLHLLIKDNFLK